MGINKFTDEAAAGWLGCGRGVNFISCWRKKGRIFRCQRCRAKASSSRLQYLRYT